MMAATETTELSSLIRRDRTTGMATIELAVEGVMCAGCINRIESALKRTPGVEDARLNFTTKRLTIGWRDQDFQPSIAIDTVEKLGYRARPMRQAEADNGDRATSRYLLRCLGVAGFAAMNIMLLSVSVWSGNVTDITPETRDLFHWLSALIALPAAAYAGRPFFQSAWSVLRNGHVNMDVPISLGIMLALGMSLAETANHAEHAYFDSAIMLIFFLLCGRFADHTLRRKTRSVAENLAAFKAETAHRISDDNELVLVPASALRPGDRVLVKPGERIPADGRVVSGSSSIDESIVTGESAPRSIGTDDNVYAGSLNIGAAITLKITRQTEDSFVAEVDRLLHRAVTSKSRYVRLADRAAGLYAPVVHTASALTLVGWLAAGASVHDAIITAISVLIITCPCALALAVPAVQVVAANRFFRSGIFLNAGDAIERFADVDTVVFDKTGTLTLPEPQLINAERIAPDLLEQAARLALSTKHPLAASLARHASGSLPFDDVSEEPGRGIRTTIGGVEARLGSLDFCGVDPGRAGEAGASSLLAFKCGDRSAIFLIGQSLRPDAAATVNALRRLGLHVKILSGDRAEAVAPVANGLGVSDWQGSLKPGDKVAVLESLKWDGRRILMVGDGINDAAALATAWVSLSPISASDLSQAQADGVFLGESLRPVAETVATSRAARALMHQNLWLAAIYNALAVPLAIAGLVTPLIAAAAMSGSSIIVTLNALRLGLFRQAGGKAATSAMEAKTA
jgi:Cu2+-exporting ATPase